LDIQYLIDRLEALIVAGRKVPMTSKVMIDEEALTSLVDQMHAVIPDEIKQSKRILAERERIIDNAHSEADEIIRMAKEQADFMLQEKGLLKASQEQADRIIRESEEEADRIRVGADSYASQVLTDFEELLAQQLRVVRNGRARLSSGGAAPGTNDADVEKGDVLPSSPQNSQPVARSGVFRR